MGFVSIINQSKYMTLDIFKILHVLNVALFTFLMRNSVALPDPDHNLACVV